ncbi:hypothetical protein [Flavobacterium sp.]|uniref:hypothetical protein n=1 Tax=Flavobacterium sp. TaxID=239 RepID=UPI003C3B7203
MAKYKDQNTELDATIARVKMERKIKLDALKDQMEVTYKSVKPSTILNDTLEDLKQFPEVKSNILQLVTSLAGGYLTKKLLIGKPKSTFKKIVGYLVQYGITNLISKKVHNHP